MKKRFSIYMIVFLFMVLFNICHATPLHDAARRGEIDKVKKIMSTNPKLIKERDRFGDTPLQLAANFGRPEIVIYLISKGADVNTKNNVRNTPLHKAVLTNQFEVVKILVKEGANINSRNKENKTPLDFAKEWKYKKIINHLRKHGAEE